MDTITKLQRVVRDIFSTEGRVYSCPSFLCQAFEWFGQQAGCFILQNTRDDPNSWCATFDSDIGIEGIAVGEGDTAFAAVVDLLYGMCGQKKGNGK